MHASNSNFAPISPAATPEMQPNATECNVPHETPSPTFRPAATPPSPSGSSLPSLTPRQLTAISLLISGDNVDLVAAKLKIHRATLYRWRYLNPTFRAELNARLATVRDHAAAHLRRLLRHALTAVENQVTKAHYMSERSDAALKLLRHCNLPALLAPAEDAPKTPAQALDELIRHDWQSRNLDPSLSIDDAVREDYLETLRTQGAFDDPESPTPTHPRLRGGLPYPTPDAPHTPAMPTQDTPEQGGNPG